MTHTFLKPAALLLALSTTSCASMMMHTAPAAPQPLKPIADNQFFHGRWYEIARTPISLTTNCMAGTTDFGSDSTGNLIETDECRKGSPEGPAKTFRGRVQFLNSGQNTEFTVHYTLYGFIPVSETYWVLDHATDYTWFIVSDPGFTHVDILSRAPRSSPATVSALTARVRALGYDTSKLEYPPTFPPGEG